MSSVDPKYATGSGSGGPFATTRWSLVLSAGQGGSKAAEAALEDLCRIYWQPVCAYARRQVGSDHEAEDLTQAFFARLLEKSDLAVADPGRGRFRAWLLASVQHFLANEWKKGRAQKRGGGKKLLALDPSQRGGGPALELADPLTAERLYERQWALTLLERVLGLLRDELVAEGRAELFERLKPYLTAGPAARYAEVARELGASAGAVKVAVHRLRRRYRELLRAEIAHTVADPSEIDDEINSLFAALAS